MLLFLILNQLACHPKNLNQTITWIGKHEPIELSISSNLLANRYFCVTKINNPSLLTSRRTWNCWRKTVKPNCNQSLWKAKLTAKSGYTRLSASLMNEAVSIRVKQESTITNVSRMGKKHTHPLIFSGIKKI